MILQPLFAMIILATVPFEVSRYSPRLWPYSDLFILSVNARRSMQSKMNECFSSWVWAFLSTRAIKDQTLIQTKWQNQTGPRLESITLFVNLYSSDVLTDVLACVIYCQSNKMFPLLSTLSVNSCSGINIAYRIYCLAI